jgi:hypothetical protein
MEDVIAHARSYVKAQLDSILIGTFFGTPNEKFKLAVEEKENELLSDPGRHFEGYNDLNEQQKSKQGKLKIDATVADQYIRYPND